MTPHTQNMRYCMRKSGGMTHQKDTETTTSSRFFHNLSPISFPIIDIRSIGVDSIIVRTPRALLSII